MHKNVLNILTFFFLIYPQLGFGQAVKAPAPEQKKNITSAVRVYYQKTGDQAERKHILAHGVPFAVPGGSIKLGPRHDSVWLYFSLEPHGRNYFLEFSTGLIDSIHLYRRGPEGQYHLLYRSGDKLPAKTRPMRFRTYVFPLRVEPGKTSEYMIRLQNSIFTSTQVTLYSPAAFRSYSIWNFLSYGLLYGIMLAMVLYNLFLAYSLDNKTYFFYVLTIAFALFYQVFLSGTHLFLECFGDFNSRRLQYFFLGGYIAAASQFVRYFLATQEHTPLLDKLIFALRYIGYAVAVVGVLAVTTAASVGAHGVAFVAPVLVLLAGFKRLAQGYRPARYFLIAWAAFLTGLMPMALDGLVASFQPPMATPFLLAVGTSLEALFLSFALADRIKQLREEKESLAESKNNFEKKSITDSLTGLYNNGYYRKRIQEEIQHARQLNLPLTLLLFDLDNFKNLNDQYGHLLGDKVLIQFARIIGNAIRQSDVGCRYGGEEFTVILPATPVARGQEIADRIRTLLEKQSFRDQGYYDNVTVSCGLAELDPTLPPSQGGQKLFEQADEALYHAKDQGKNQSVVYG